MKNKPIYPSLKIKNVQYTIGTHFLFDDNKNKLTDSYEKIHIKTMYIYELSKIDWDFINSHSIIVIDESSYIDTTQHLKCWLKK